LWAGLKTSSSNFLTCCPYWRESRNAFNHSAGREVISLTKSLSIPSLGPGISPASAAPRRPRSPKDYSQLLNGKSSNGTLNSESLSLARQTDNTGEKLHTPLQHGTPMLPSKERWPKPLRLPVRTAEKPDEYQRSTTDSVFLPPWVMPKTNRQKRARQCQAQLQQ